MAEIKVCSPGNEMEENIKAAAADLPVVQKRWCQCRVRSGLKSDVRREEETRGVDERG